MDSIYKKYAATIILVWVSCFIFFLLIYAIIVSPQKEQKKEIGQRLAEQRQIYDVVSNTNRPEIQIQLAQQMQQWKDKLKDFVANPQDLAGLTFDIGQIASDIKLDSFSIKTTDSRKSQDESKYQYVYENQISVTFKSDFNKFAAFISAMERHRPVIFVDRFSISHSDQDDSAAQVSMDLSVFVRKQQGS